MNCPTCCNVMVTYTMGYFHCAICGTLKMIPGVQGQPASVFVPKLVERCREFENVAALAEKVGFKKGWIAVEWQRLGIAEVINPPEGRPT